MIPLANTRISIYRAPDGIDPYETPQPRKKLAGIRAHIGSPSGRDHIIGGHQEVINAKLGCDPCDLQHGDTVKDETTGAEYVAVWVTQRTGLGVDHLEAGLNLVAGAANG